MEYRNLGRSGCVVSSLALGTMTFGNETDEAGSHAQLDRFVEAGGTLIDTADVYTRGASESIIGRWLAKQSAETLGNVVIATKGRFAMGEGKNDLGLSRRHLRQALDASLERLQVDHIDLYQVHSFDPLTPLDETWSFLDDAVRAGKIAYVGLSNYTGWQIQKVVDLADFRGLARPVTLQPQYNLLARDIEFEIVPACESTGLGLLPWSPLGGGWLTGKYKRDERPTGATRLGDDPQRGVEAYDRRGPQQRTWDVIEAVQAIAGDRGVSMAQVALAWVVDRPLMTSVILGARTLEQLEDNLGAAGLHLTPRRPSGSTRPARRLRTPTRTATSASSSGRAHCRPDTTRQALREGAVAAAPFGSVSGRILSGVALLDQIRAVEPARRWGCPAKLSRGETFVRHPPGIGAFARERPELARRTGSRRTGPVTIGGGHGSLSAAHLRRGGLRRCHDDPRFDDRQRRHRAARGRVRLAPVGDPVGLDGVPAGDRGGDPGRRLGGRPLRDAAGVHGAVAAFAGGSLLCGLAWSAGSLIAFRVLQGLGGGLVMPVGMTILAHAAGQDRMGRAMAIVGVPMLLAPAIGPVVGGALLDGASWRLIFFINLPVAALALVLAARVLPRTQERRPTRFDLLGLALLSPGLTALVAGLAAPAGGGAARAPAHVGLALVVAFVFHARRTEHPLIDVRIFRDRVVAAATATTLLFGAAFFGSLLLLALYYQLARDLSATATGLVLAAQGVGAMLTMPVAGKLTDRVGAGSVVRVGVVLVIAGTLPFAFVADDVPGWLLVCGLFLRGAGMGATLMPAMAAAYQALPEAAVARAASALEIVQRAGATLGIALLAVILQHSLATRGFHGSLDTLDDAPVEPLTAAAGQTFTWALVLTALTLVPALLLPRRREQADSLQAAQDLA